MWTTPCKVSKSMLCGMRELLLRASGQHDVGQDSGRCWNWCWSKLVLELLAYTVPWPKEEPESAAPASRTD